MIILSSFGHRDIEVGLFAITLFVVTVTLTAIQCIKKDLAPEVVNDENPGTRFVNQNRFNPSILKPKMLTIIMLYLAYWMWLVCILVYKTDYLPDLVKILTPGGFQINRMTLVSLLSSVLFPMAIYLTNTQARTHLKGLVMTAFA